MITICFLTILACCHLLDGSSLYCDNQLTDIVFVLDSSDSIAQNDYESAISAIAQTIDSLAISRDKNRVGLVQFSTTAVLKFNLDTFDNSKDMLNVLKSKQHTQGLTAIGKALKLTVDEVMPKMRINASRIVILITDGTNTNFPAPQLSADTLKGQGVRLICIGIGSEINKVELKLLASENSLMFLSNFKQIQQQLKLILDHTCYLPDPVPAKPCTVPQQDLVFLIDSSSSLNDADFNISKELLKNWITQTVLGPNDTRFAMITFSDVARLEFNIDAYSTQKEYKDAIRKVTRFGSNTAIGLALREALTSVFPKRRPDVPFNVILITDGVNTMYPKPIIPAKELKKKGANIVSVGIGMSIDFDELRQLSSDNKVVTSSSYIDIMESVQSLQRVVTCG